MSKTINKAALVDVIAKKYILTKKSTTGIVEDLFALISEALEEGKDVNIDGFGKFTTKIRSRRVFFNPTTRQNMIIPSAVCPLFKPSKELKDRINSKRYGAASGPSGKNIMH